MAEWKDSAGPARVEVAAGVILLTVRDAAGRRLQVGLGTIDAEALARDLRAAIKVAERQMREHPRLIQKKRDAGLVD